MSGQSTQYEDLRIALSRWRRRIIALLWVTYATFYLCRVNLAAAQKDLAVARGLTKGQLGRLIALLKICYAVGQFINGALADRLGARRLIVMGLAASAGLNLVFAHLNDFRWMAITWAANGYFQACGWTPVVRTIANWFPARLRDAASGIIGTSYILGSGISWLVAGKLTDAYGWRYAFWAPAWVCLAATVMVILAIRERPDDVGLGGIDDAADAATDEAPAACWGWGECLGSARLWALGLAMMCFTLGYHGLLDWTPHYLAEAGRLDAAQAARRAFVMPLGGALGCIGLTWLARRRSAQFGPAAVAAPLVLLAILTFQFPTLATRAPWAVAPGLALLGALSAIPASLMACAMPANIAGPRSAGAAAGFIDAMGYVGSAISGWASGRIMTRVGAVHGQAAAWRSVWRFWPVGMMVSAVLVLLSGRASS